MNKAATTVFVLVAAFSGCSRFSPKTSALTEPLATKPEEVSKAPSVEAKPETDKKWAEVISELGRMTEETSKKVDVTYIRRLMGHKRWMDIAYRIHHSRRNLIQEEITVKREAILVQWNSFLLGSLSSVTLERVLDNLTDSLDAKKPRHNLVGEANETFKKIQECIK